MTQSFQLAIILGVCASAQAMPMDSLFSGPGSMEAGASTRSEMENNRITWGAKAMLRDFGDSSLVVWDSFLVRQDPTTDASGEKTIQALWSSGSFDASGKFLGRAGGLGATNPSLAEHAWLVQGLGRWRWQRPGLDAALIGGLLAEAQDPGSLTQPLEPGEQAGSGGTNVQGGFEASWQGRSDLAPFLEGFWIQDLIPSRLRWSRAGIATGGAASVTGEGSDSLRVRLEWDTLRLRSSRFSANLGEGNVQATVGWNLSVGRQSWLLEGSWDRNIQNDATCRSPGQERRTSQGAIAVSSPLPAGLVQAHRLELDLEERRWWTSPLAGTPDLWAGEDHKNDDQTRTLRLSDSLTWSSQDTSWTISAILQQSLAEVRHPENESPASTDRPDEDLSVRMLTLSVRSSRFAPADRSLAGWTTLLQQDVFPRSSQSVRTSTRHENRLWGDAMAPIHDVARPMVGIWAREQRNDWRFDASRASGLLDLGWSVGVEAGPHEAPWAVVRFSEGTIKTGALLAEGFAPDRIQEDWILSLSGDIPVGEEFKIGPWGRRQLERSRSWDGTVWMAPDRSTSSRLGTDGSWESGPCSVSLGLGHQWNDPGIDSWIARGEARWIF